MADSLSRTETRRLIRLGKNIQRSLAVDLNGHGFPPRTDRLAAVRSMIEYLEIHDYKVTDILKEKENNG